MKNRRLVSTLTAFVLLLALGSLGYRYIEGPAWTFSDGLYMTVITLATVGYGEVHPLTAPGRLFTVFLIFSGVGLAAYTITALGQFVVEGKLREMWGRRRMRERISGLRGHYIICGAGNTGMVVADNLTRKQVPCVLVDQDPKVIRQLLDEDLMAIEGDATLDEVLNEAGLSRAAGLVTALPHDADNVFVALTAKGINADIFVVATVTKMESVPKLKRAGANYVVSPNIIAGARMASVLMRPSVVDFIDATMAGDDAGLQMEEMRICPDSYLNKKALKDADVRARSGAIIVSVRHEGKTTINPEPTFVFEAGDILVALGTRDQINKMGELASQSNGRS